MRYRASVGKLKYIIDSTKLRIMSAACKKNVKVGVTQNMLVAQVCRKLIIAVTVAGSKLNRILRYN